MCCVGVCRVVEDCFCGDEVKLCWVESGSTSYFCLEALANFMFFFTKRALAFWAKSGPSPFISWIFTTWVVRLPPAWIGAVLRRWEPPASISFSWNF